MEKTNKRLRIAVLPMLLAAPLAWAAEPGGKPAPLQEETIGVERIAPPDGNRLYVADVVFNHMADSRIHVLDGAKGSYLGVLDTGFSALGAVSRDGRQIYVATTYYPRLTRGKRTDLLEIHDGETLQLKAEIEIPAKHAQAIPYRGMLTPSADGRFLYVQNATPATSVTVVDLKSQKFVTEIPTPGCWSIHAWENSLKFSTICGDGTLMTVSLDQNGQPASRERSTRFFDPDKDPIYVHPEMRGDDRYFVSYYGNVYRVRLAGEHPAFHPAWSILDEQDKQESWRPGGFEVTAMHRRSGTLFINMHDHGAEGSHKNPSKEIWAFDVETHQRVARIPSNSAVSIVASQGDKPLLYSLDVEHGEIVVRKIQAGYPKLTSITGVGETSVTMEVR